MTVVPPAPAASRRDYLLLSLVLLGLTVRVAFWLYGHRFYYGSYENSWQNGDTVSYTWGWENLWLHGHYTFDFLYPDAAFGRLPGYPLFYGLHYLLAGPAHAVWATQLSQVLLDTLAVWLIFRITFRIAQGRGWAPYVGAALYAVYPFVLIWLTMIATEALATFITVLWAWVVVERVGGRWHVLVVGLVIGAAFYIREYLGIFLPITGLWWWLTTARATGQVWSWPALKPGVWLGVVFLALYIWWPVRNYVSYNRLMLVKPLTAGYAAINDDFIAYRNWIITWSDDFTPYLKQIVKDGKPAFPADVFASPAEHAEARRLSALAHECGSSFWLWKRKLYLSKQYRDTAWMRAQTAYWNHCNAEVATGFQRLDSSYRARHPIAARFEVPARNVVKSVFKNQLARQAPSAQLIQTLLFSYRTVLVILGFVGLWVMRRRVGIFPVGALILFIYLFICFFLRVLEMRYLLQADALLLVPAALLIGSWLDRWLAGRVAPPIGAALSPARTFAGTYDELPQR